MFTNSLFIIIIIRSKLELLGIGAMQESEHLLTHTANAAKTTI